MSEMERDITTIQVFPENEMTVGISTILGTRENQEDTVYSYTRRDKTLAVVCDGMGGLKGGKMASDTAVKTLVNAYFKAQEIENVPVFLKEQAVKADEEVYLLNDEENNPLGAGTTLAAVLIQGNKLYLLSVGDSKIYIIRGQEIIAANREHNYRMQLDELLEKGSITKEEYEQEEYRAEALISYVGMGNMSLMDVSKEPFLLQEGDMVLLSSDGLYRSLSEEEILEIVQESEEDMQRAAQTLTARALGDKQSGQDNTSVIILRYLGENK